MLQSLRNTFISTSKTVASHTNKLQRCNNRNFVSCQATKLPHPKSDYALAARQNCSNNYAQVCISKILPSVRSFHTSSPRRVPPFLLLAVKSVGKGLAILTGRGARKWWRNLPADKKHYFWTELRKNKIKVLVATGLSVVLLGIYYETHIQETPITKRKRFLALTTEQFRQIADFEFQLQQQIYENELLPTKDPSYQRVGKIVQALLTANSNLRLVPNRVWSISIIDNPIQNAFVLPGGQIFVFKGMLDLCKRDDELAVILAHEISHCILEHGAEQLSYSHLLDFAVIAVLAAIWAFVPSDGIAVITQWFFHKVISVLLSLPYSRKLETEADEVGLELAAKACFDVRESSAFWSQMALNEKLETGDVDIDWFSTHPRHEARSAHLDSIMAKAIELRNQCGCPRLPKQDPRDDVNIFRRKIEVEMERRKSEPKALEIVVAQKTN